MPESSKPLAMPESSKTVQCPNPPNPPPLLASREAILAFREAGGPNLPKRRRPGRLIYTI